MKFIYLLRHHFITCIILVSLCLQSCIGLNKPAIPPKQGPIQAVSILDYKQALFDLDFLTQEEHEATFCQEGTQLRAEVEEKLPDVFNRLHHLSVAIAQGKIMDQVMDADLDQQKPIIHVHLPKSNHSGRAYIGNVGLMGGSNTGGKGKEKLTEDEQIASETDPEVINSLVPLHMAAVNGKLETARLLLLQGAQINASDQFGCTPLHRAASKGHTGIVRLLLEQGADAYAQEYNGVSALHLASLHGHFPVVNLLFLQGVDINVQDKDGYSPLFLATRSQNIHMIAVLISRGADVNVKNKLGNTPLYEAVRRANLVMVKLLRNEGANVNVQNIYGWTPLHLAAYGLPEIVKYLVASGANINIKNIEGFTSSQLAKQESQFVIAQLLLKTKVRKY
jgi:ankyrin repeat protein